MKLVVEERESEALAAHVSSKSSQRNDASPPGRAGRMRYKDAESPNSSAIGATEDAVARRPARHGDTRLHFVGCSKPRRVVTSRLATVEVARAVRLANDSIEAQALAREILDGVFLVDVGATILTAASALATAHIRTLDAIHLATIEFVNPDEVLVYDHRLRDAVRETGYVTTSPGDD